MSSPFISIAHINADTMQVGNPIYRDDLAEVNTPMVAVGKLTRFSNAQADYASRVDAIIKAILFAPATLRERWWKFEAENSQQGCSVVISVRHGVLFARGRNGERELGTVEQLGAGRSADGWFELALACS